MDLIKELNLGTAAELAICAAVVLVLTQAVKQTKLNNKWLPWVAMAIGAVAGLVSVAVTKDTNWGPAAVMGLLVGAASAGLFDGVKSLTVTPPVGDPTPAEPVQVNPQGPLVPDNVKAADTSRVTSDDSQH